ncbi:MAG: STAS domain-containing protein [Ruminococcus sp.]|nr:STAS domain-containing protein [Ruminococcus sp.]
MKITKKTNGSELTIAVEGRLDTLTAPDLDKEIKASIDGVKALYLDFADLEYISSAGLRTLLSAQKAMSSRGGSMTVKNCADDIMEIFEITGFLDILTVE